MTSSMEGRDWGLTPEEGAGSIRPDGDKFRSMLAQTRSKKPG